VAAASPALHDNDGNPQRVVWPFPTPLRGILEAVGLGKFGHKRSFVIGATLLLRWEAIQEVGSFDERFFLYAEETDWQRRCQQVGWSSVLCPDVTGFHAGAGTSDDPARREALFHAGQETYIRKWYGRSGWWIYRGAVAAGAVARFIVLRGERRRSAARRAVLYVRGPRRAAGVS
jgi:GT2 family glycosyltransferase